MNIRESLQDVTRLFLDTAPVIYFVEENSRYFAVVDAIFDRILDGSVMAVTSPVTLAECLVRPYRLGQTELQQEYIDVIVGGDNITFVEINQNMGQQAAEIRGRYNIELRPDN